MDLSDSDADADADADSDSDADHAAARADRTPRVPGRLTARSTRPGH